MLRVVIDTSSLVSYALTHGDLMRRVIAYWREEWFSVLSSPSTRDELKGVLSRPLIRRLAVMPLDELVGGVERYTLTVPGNLALSGICRDPKDDKFLACAVEGGAQYIVSSDRDLLEMRIYQGVGILNPGQFLLALELDSMQAGEMARKYGFAKLDGIQRALPLEPETAARLAVALADSAGEEQ